MKAIFLHCTFFENKDKNEEDKKEVIKIFQKGFKALSMKS